MQSRRQMQAMPAQGLRQEKPRLPRGVCCHCSCSVIIFNTRNIGAAWAWRMREGGCVAAKWGLRGRAHQVPVLVCLLRKAAPVLYFCAGGVLAAATDAGLRLGRSNVAATLLVTIMPIPSQLREERRSLNSHTPISEENTSPKYCKLATTKAMPRL